MATSPENSPRTAPYKTAGLILIAVLALIATLVMIQFRGGFTDKVQLTMMATRSGLVMDKGSKVTFNGVEIGRVADVSEVQEGDRPEAKIILDVYPEYIELIPFDVVANIRATTVFGNKYISFTSPPNSSADVPRIKPSDIIDARSVTTEFNTLFETLTEISQQVDPVKLNVTLSAAAEALDGLGGKFGESLLDGNEILANLNPLMPQINRDIVALTALTDIYADASPDLWAALENAVVTARTFNDERDTLDRALLAAVGFGNTGADVFGRGAPYLVRGAADLRPTADLLNEYSPEVVCTVRGLKEAVPLVNGALGANGYSLAANVAILGAENPYVFPDNLPRVNASGGPGGSPGCWASIDRDSLWPAPFLVMDTGASIAPYNHFELGQPILQEYVWGRQGGELTINP
ncbi:MAG: MCE family protein [Mycobacterium sp.]